MSSDAEKCPVNEVKDRFDTLDKRVDNVHVHLDGIYRSLTDHRARLDRLERDRELPKEEPAAPTGWLSLEAHDKVCSKLVAERDDHKAQLAASRLIAGQRTNKIAQLENRQEELLHEITACRATNAEYVAERDELKADNHRLWCVSQEAQNKLRAKRDELHRMLDSMCGRCAELEQELSERAVPRPAIAEKTTDDTDVRFLRGRPGRTGIRQGPLP